MIRNRRGNNIGRILVLEFNDNEINIFTLSKRVIQGKNDSRDYYVYGFLHSYLLLKNSCVPFKNLEVNITIQ